MSEFAYMRIRDSAFSSNAAAHICPYTTRFSLVQTLPVLTLTFTMHSTAGGAVCVYSASGEWTQVERSVFTLNLAGEAAGAVGVVATPRAGAVTFTDTDFVSNWVVGLVTLPSTDWLANLWGGGALVLLQAPARGVVVDRCKFTSNHVARSVGDDSACMASFLETAGKGGAILMSSCTLNVTDTLFSGNLACDGGAL